MVVFDMAGTTINEHNIVYKTLHTSINNFGYSCTLAQVLQHGAGKEKAKAIADILEAIGVELSTALVTNIYEQFVISLKLAYEQANITPQIGAMEVFNVLRTKNIKVILNTGYDSLTATTLLNLLNWQVGKEIDMLVTASDVTIGRPNPAMIKKAMQAFEITNCEEVAKVGDSIIDIEEGKNAGCALTVGITTGAHTYEQLSTANPSAIINNLQALIPLLH